MHYVQMQPYQLPLVVWGNNQLLPPCQHTALACKVSYT